MAGNTLDQELERPERYQLLIVDEVGYLPLGRQAANLLFALFSRRYERGSIIITSNRTKTPPPAPRPAFAQLAWGFSAPEPNG
jgi:DNA replication protein DnaC